jgi:hypothetical protein
MGGCTSMAASFCMSFVCCCGQHCCGARLVVRHGTSSIKHGGGAASGLSAIVVHGEVVYSTCGGSGSL